MTTVPVNSGRYRFAKYKKIIEIMVKFTRLLPKGMRKLLFNHIRNYNGTLGILGRYVLIKTLAKSVGDNVAIFPGCYFEHIEGLSIGNNVSIHQMCYIDSEGGIDIGDDVSIAHRTSILSSNHGYKDKNTPIKYQQMELAKTSIENNCWIGCGVVILAGVVIGSGCVVGANSTVTKSLPSKVVAYGSPAKVIKER